jgi:hypothetical protein
MTGSRARNVRRTLRLPLRAYPLEQGGAYQLLCGNCCSAVETSAGRPQHLTLPFYTFSKLFVFDKTFSHFFGIVRISSLYLSLPKICFSADLYNCYDTIFTGNMLQK